MAQEKPPGGGGGISELIRSTRAHAGQPMLFSTSMRDIRQSVLSGPAYAWWVREHLGGCSLGHTRDQTKREGRHDI